MPMARLELVITDEQGNVVPNAKVKVEREQPGQPMAALFSDRTGITPLDNPLTSDAQGVVAFHTRGGPLKIRAWTGASDNPTFERIRRYVPLGLAGETDGAGIAVNASGNFADRDDYDEERQGFVYLSQDGDGAGNIDAVLFLKNSAGDGDWSDAILIRGDRGGDRYEIPSWDSDRPASGEEVIGYLMTTEVTFLAAFAGSVAKAIVASSETAVYSVRKNGVQIGTLTFNTGNTSGVFAMASPNTFLPNDRFSVIAPDPRDATLSGVAMTFVASR